MPFSHLLLLGLSPHSFINIAALHKASSGPIIRDETGRWIASFLFLVFEASGLTFAWLFGKTF